MGCKASKAVIDDDDNSDAASYSSHSSTFQENLLRERCHKTYEFDVYYEKVGKLGAGAASQVFKVKKRSETIGGSSQRNYVKYHKSKKQFFKRKTSLEKTDSSFSASDRSPEIIYACKEMHPHLEDLEPLKKEIELLKKLDHPHIIRAYETFQVDNKLLIILEFCEGGTLVSRFPFSEDEVARIVRQICQAVAYLHKNNIVHRDLKMENIMFATKDEDSKIKVIDFGLSAKYEVKDHFTDRVGTLYSMSPEAIQSHYSTQTDLWSIGVVAYMLLSGGVKPFGEELDDPKDVIVKIFQGYFSFEGPYWEQVSHDAKEFIRALLKVCPDERLTAEQALNHPWLEKGHYHSKEKLCKTSVLKAKSSIVKYANSNEVYKLGMNAIAKKSTSEEVGNLYEIFHMFDLDGDGWLGRDEFKMALSYLNFSDEECDKIFRGLDVNQNDVITYTEFLAATLQSKGRIEEHRIADAFDHLDLDNDGYISHSDLKKILGKNYDAQHVAGLIKGLDIAGDGRISYEEFKLAFTGDEDSSTGGAEAEHFVTVQNMSAVKAMG